MKLTDESEMPYGKYEGWLMKDVPASYLLWLNDNTKTSPSVQAYIDDNWEGLEQDVEEK